MCAPAVVDPGDGVERVVGCIVHAAAANRGLPLRGLHATPPTLTLVRAKPQLFVPTFPDGNGVNSHPFRCRSGTLSDRQRGWVGDAVHCASRIFFVGLFIGSLPVVLMGCRCPPGRCFAMLGGRHGDAWFGGPRSRGGHRLWCAAAQGRRAPGLDVQPLGHGPQAGERNG